MATRLYRLVSVVFLVAVFATPGRAEPPLLRDHFGDLLPPQAIARMGTIRWRHSNAGGTHGVTAVASPDGQLVATRCNMDGTETNSTVRVWNMADGKPICEIPYEKKHRGDYAFLPDSSRLILFIPGGAMDFYDPKTGQRIEKTEQIIDPEGYPRCDAVNGRWFFTEHGGPKLTEIATKSSPKQVKLEEPKEGWKILERPQFGADANAFVAVCRDKPKEFGSTHTAYRWDTRTGKLLGSAPMREAASAMMTDISADGSRFATWKRNEKEVNDTLLVWDTTSEKLLAELPGGPRNGWGRFEFSPDGKRVIADVGNGRYWLWDVATGKQLGHAELPPWCHNTRLLADGKTVLAWAFIGVRFGTWDLTTGQQLSSDVGHDSGVSQLEFTPDGKRLLSSAHATEDPVTIWDAETGKRIQQLAGTRKKPKDDGIGWTTGSFVLTPDGDVVTTDEGTLVWTDAKTGKQIRRVTPEVITKNLVKDKIFGSTYDDWVVMVTDPETGKPLVCGLYAFGPPGFNSIDPSTYTASLHDPESGVPIASRTYATSIKVSPSGTVARFPSKEENPTAILFQSVFQDYGSSLLKIPPFKFGHFQFSPDGRTLVTMESRQIKIKNPWETTFRVWEVSSGKERASFVTPGWYSRSSAISHDGRFLADHQNLTISIWDLSTGKVVAERNGFRCHASALAFRPDGKTLASGHVDGTSLIWELPELSSVKPVATDRDAAWNDLASEDAGKAYRAILALAADPECAKFLRDKVKPTPPIPAGEISKLVQELGHAEFQKREAASKALKKYGSEADVELYRMSRDDISLEQRQRIENILEKRTMIESDLVRLRSLRCVEVLERANTTEARQLLDTLARGAPGARLTTEAMLAIQRSQNSR